jgi:hypothetical protein
MKAKDKAGVLKPFCDQRDIPSWVANLYVEHGSMTYYHFPWKTWKLESIASDELPQPVASEYLETILSATKLSKIWQLIAGEKSTQDKFEYSNKNCQDVMNFLVYQEV